MRAEYKIREKYFEKFNNMFRGWSYNKKPTWYKKIIQIAKKADLIKNYTL